MNRGRFSKSRQKANSSARGLSIVTERSTLTAFRALTVAARPVTRRAMRARSTASAGGAHAERLVDHAVSRGAALEEHPADQRGDQSRRVAPSNA